MPSSMLGWNSDTHQSSSIVRKTNGSCYYSKLRGSVAKISSDSTGFGSTNRSCFFRKSLALQGRCWTGNIFGIDQQGKGGLASTIQMRSHLGRTSLCGLRQSNTSFRRTASWTDLGASTTTSTRYGHGVMTRQLRESYIVLKKG